MNTTNQTQIFLLLTTTSTLRPLRKPFVKNPFDSWYIGGLLFMCTLMFVLLYANYYRENSCQNFWIRLLIKLRLLPSHTSEPFLI